MTINSNEVTVEFLEAFADAWNRHDVDDLMSFMTDDCVFESSGGNDTCGTRFEGQEAVRKDRRQEGGLYLGHSSPFGPHPPPAGTASALRYEVGDSPRTGRSTPETTRLSASLRNL